MSARLLLAALLAGLLPTSQDLQAQGQPLGFEETFALSTDRAATLELLIPGTGEAYRYTCLALQQAGSLTQVPAVLAQWEAQHGRTAQLLEMERRQALLAFEQDPAATWRYLKDNLGVRLDHQRQIPGAVPDLPTSLDPALLDWDTLARRALQRNSQSVNGFEQRAMSELLDWPLNDAQLADLLDTLDTPDHPGLLELISKNMASRNFRGFGSLGIHWRLTLGQLDALAAMQPDLLGSSQWVADCLRRLLPPDGVDWEQDLVEYEAYLTRLEAFARRLPESQQALLAHVLYHRLAFDRSRGVYDSARFLEYLAIPRNASWTEPRHLKDRRAIVSLGEGYPTQLGIIGDDEPLVRAYLEHAFRTADDTEVFEPYVRLEILRRIFAETKILYGLGDMERWYAMLDDPAGYEALKDRVEIEFAPTQPELFAVDAPVSLDVELKNVGTLLVKVFEIDAFNVYSTRGEEIDVSLDLDGLVAHEESAHTLDEPPLRRVAKRFDFPSMDRPGVWVVELIGNGLSSRAVIRKGSLRASQRLGAAGHVFRVYDELGTPLPDASIWFGGRDYTATTSGEIVLPYSTDQGTKAIVLRHGDRASLDEFEHAFEDYSLRMSNWVDREGLLPGAMAKLLVRPRLMLNSRPVSLSLLEDPVLRLAATNSEGVTTTSEVTELELMEDAELVHEFPVPERLVSLDISLTASVRSLSLGQDVELETSDPAFRLSGILPTSETSAFLLEQTPSGYALRARGRNGEPVADRVLRLQLKHEDFREPIDAQLKTDAQGRISLGPLAGILAVTMVGTPGEHHSWELVPARRSRPAGLRALEGQTLRVPYDGEASEVSPSVASLFELRGGFNAFDRSQHLALAGRFLEVRDLPAGDYVLRIQEDRTARADRIDVHVAPGTVRNGWAVSRDQLVPLDEITPLQVTRLGVDDDTLVVQLAHARPEARVHIVATRSTPVYHPYSRMFASDGSQEDISWSFAAESGYHSGREISDEARYILDRRYAATFPGNMLQRPSLLLNPWELSESETMVGVGGGAGGGFGRRGKAAGRSSGATMSSWNRNQVQPNPGEFPDLSYLPEPTILHANLRPDESGAVRIALAELGPGRLVHVLALDAESTVYRSLALRQKPLVPRDVRLTQALPAGVDISEQRVMEILPTGATAVVEDIATSELELYDSLGAVFRLYATLDESQELDAWRFLLGWPELSREEQLEAYDEFASHELHLFLHEKDTAFFDEIVRPYLANKASKTFLDHWLLDAELDGYLEPYAWSQLNTMERILLARRLPEQLAAVTRGLAEQLELLPPDPAGERRLFELALMGSALDAKDDFAGAMREAKQELAKNKARAAADESVDWSSSGLEAVSEAPAAAPMAPEEVAELQALGYVDAGALTGRGRRLDADADMRDEVRSLYRGPGRTKAFVEQNYWHRRVYAQDARLITPSAFWLGFARTDRGEAFLSTHIAQAGRHVNEMLLALALLDLPFEAGEHVTTIEGARMTLTTAGPAVLVRQELRPAAPAEDAAPLLVGQEVFRADERYRYEGNQRRELYVRGELLTDVVYGTQVVVSNPTSEPRALELLLQVPQGAISVANGRQTAGLDLPIPPLGSVKSEVLFYFPEPGDYPLYPAHVSHDGLSVAAAEARTLHVVSEPSTVDETSWEHVSQSGTLDQVLAYIAQSNPGRLDLSRIAWRMRDARSYELVLAALRGRHLFDRTLWGYGLLHQDAGTTGELLQMDPGFLSQCGPVLVSPLVAIDPVQRRFYEHMEFDPLVNERSHAFGGQRRILNAAVAAQYAAFLDVTAYRARLADADWLDVTYYLLLQDRVEEALASFARVDRDAVDADLQYDYADAYLDFFTNDHTRARGIAQTYRDHPVPRWRDRFRNVLNQLDEAAGVGVAVADPDDREQSQTALAAEAPSLELSVADGRVTLRHENLDGCEVGYYAMDIEFLFSTNPFSQADGDTFAAIVPNRRDVLAFEPGSTETVFELPAEFRSANVLLDVRGGGLSRRETSFANSMVVQMIEAYGQVKVTDVADGTPLPKVYVKVYARSPDGRVRYHKDGYTDLRGRFDYVAHSGEGLGPVEAYSVLVLSEAHGAVIREASPPAQ